VEKEREVTRLSALQERARDEQVERDGLRARRAQKKAEREGSGGGEEEGGDGSHVD